MKKAVLVQTGIVLVRLSIAAACVSSAGLMVYIAGSVGTLSERALSHASDGAGFSGFAALVFSITGLLLNTSDKALLISGPKLWLAILSAIIASLALLVAGIVRAAVAGLSF